MLATFLWTLLYLGIPAAILVAVYFAKGNWRTLRSQGAHGASTAWTWTKSHTELVLKVVVVLVIAVLVFLLAKDAIAKLDERPAPRLVQPVVRPRRTSDMPPDLQRKGDWKPFDSIFTATIPTGKSPQWAFAGVLPPKIRMTMRGLQVVRSSGRKIETAYLLDGALFEEPMPADVLEEHASGPPGTKPVQALQAPFHHDFDNTESEDVVVLYLQVNQNDEEHKFRFEQTFAGHTVLQEIVLLDGADDASFRVPAEGWRYLWMVPIYDTEYESSLGGRPLSAKGLTGAELEQLTYSVLLAQGLPADDATRLKATVEAATALAHAPIDVKQVQYQGAYYRLGTETFALTQGTVLRATQAGIHGQEVTLGVNVRPHLTLPRPIKVLVGVAH